MTAEKLLIALLRDVIKRKLAESDIQKHMLEVEGALATVKQLSGFLHICSSCRTIRDDQGYCKTVESFIGDHAETEFTYSVWPECTGKLPPDLFND